MLGADCQVTIHASCDWLCACPFRIYVPCLQPTVVAPNNTSAPHNLPSHPISKIRNDQIQPALTCSTTFSRQGRAAGPSWISQLRLVFHIYAFYIIHFDPEFDKSRKKCGSTSEHPTISAYQGLYLLCKKSKQRWIMCHKFRWTHFKTCQGMLESSSYKFLGPNPCESIRHVKILLG